MIAFHKYTVLLKKKDCILKKIRLHFTILLLYVTVNGRKKLEEKERKKEKVRKEDLFWRALYIYEQSSMLTILFWGVLNIYEKSSMLTILF